MNNNDLKDNSDDDDDEEEEKMITKNTVHPPSRSACLLQKDFLGFQAQKNYPKKT